MKRSFEAGKHDYGDEPGLVGTRVVWSVFEQARERSAAGERARAALRALLRAHPVVARTPGKHPAYDIQHVAAALVRDGGLARALGTLSSYFDRPGDGSDGARAVTAWLDAQRITISRKTEKQERVQRALSAWERRVALLFYADAALGILSEWKGDAGILLAMMEQAQRSRVARPGKATAERMNIRGAIYDRLVGRQSPARILKDKLTGRYLPADEYLRGAISHAAKEAQSARDVGSGIIPAQRLRHWKRQKLITDRSTDDEIASVLLKNKAKKKHEPTRGMSIRAAARQINELFAAEAEEEEGQRLLREGIVNSTTSPEEIRKLLEKVTPRRTNHVTVGALLGELPTRVGGELYVLADEIDSIIGMLPKPSRRLE